MKLKRVWLMCGIPGSGKSTWAVTQASQTNGIWCSRDRVRFSLLEENEEYFAKEKIVFSYWIQEIQAAINNQDGAEDIYIDATHLNKNSRQKTLKSLNLDNVEIIAVNFNIPLETCLSRNDLRKGRAFVPRSVIRRMFYSFEPASLEEGFNKIINVNEEGEV